MRVLLLCLAFLAGCEAKEIGCPVGSMCQTRDGKVVVQVENATSVELPIDNLVVSWGIDSAGSSGAQCWIGDGEPFPARSDGYCYADDEPSRR